MTSMKFPIYNSIFILIVTLILWIRLGKRELLDRAIYFNLNIVTSVCMYLCILAYVSILCSVESYTRVALPSLYGVIP